MPDTLTARLERFGRLWAGHRTLLWRLHSIWALIAGVGVIFLAHRSYGFGRWVILFLVLIWASTFIFTRTFTNQKSFLSRAAFPGVRREVASYLTRVMYQTTLFFLIPFYWYSTVVGSPNTIFLILLVGLALLSCADVLFDRWLRRRPLFGIFYFATVAFAALNLILPPLLAVPPDRASLPASLVAVGSAIPLVMQGSVKRRSGPLWIGILALLFFLLVFSFPQLIPPVPTHLNNVTFASSVDTATLTAGDRLPPRVQTHQLRGVLFIFGEIFSPATLPSTVRLEWRRDGELIRTSRQIQLLAHVVGFRFWDAYRPETGMILPGKYEVNFRTAGNRILGIAVIQVSSE